MIFNKGKKYVFSKDVYLASDERVEKLSNDQINKYDGKEVKVGHSYLGYIGIQEYLLAGAKKLNKY